MERRTTNWLKYGVKMSLPTFLDPLPLRIKVRYGAHWYPTMGWWNAQPKGWWVMHKDTSLELMRCKRVKLFKSRKKSK